MYFEFGLRSSLLLIFFTHFLVYALLSLRRGIKQERTSDIFLGLFLFLAALFIFPWMSGFAGWYDTQPYREILFYTPFIQAYFFGPILYLYLKSLTNSAYRISRRDYLHFVPGMLYLLWSLIVVVVDKIFVGHYFLMNGKTDPDFDHWFGYTWCLSVLIYLLLTIRYYLKYRTFTYFELSYAETAGFKWLRNFLYAFSLLTLLFISEQVVSSFINLLYVRSWYYFFAFAVISYYMAISAYHAPTMGLLKLNFKPELLLIYQQGQDVQGNHIVQDADYEEIVEQQADSSWMDQWQQELLYQINVEKVFLNPSLTLTELAKKMGTNASLLSKVINTRFGVSFNELINRYRVEEVILLMKDPAYKNLNLLAIAYDAGFNSKSTFNRAFKKLTGDIPKDFLNR